MRRDRLGRRRQPDQERGLRPPHPPLPEAWASRALRVAMSREDWERFDALVRAVTESTPVATLPRAHGEVLSGLMDSASAQHRSDALEWMDWERQKALRLLRLRSAV